MALDSVLEKKAKISPSDTSDTSQKRQTYQANPLLVLACTSDTSDTSQNIKVGEDFVSWSWLIHFSDREPIYATYSPEATRGEVLRSYPGSLDAELGKGALYLVPAPEFGPPDLTDPYDDRITCPQCENFTYSGICNVARRWCIISFA